MSTLAALLPLLGETGIKPWYEGQQGVNREVIGRQQAQTGLIDLQRLKQSQASEEEVMAFYRAHPELLVGGGSTIGSLQAAPGGPGGTPAGPPSLMPGQDQNQYARAFPQGGGQGSPDMMQQAMPTVTPPGGQPQSVLASLGPQGQGPQQGLQNPLLEMARRDPRAALMLQQQMQAQQDRQWKMQEQQLSMGVKVAEFVARELQGVTDQASLDAARERIRQVHPQAAAQVPQMYSKEAVESVQQRGIAIAERANTQLAEAKARNLDMETRMFPELAKRFGMDGEAQAPAQEGVQPQVATGGGGANMGQRMNNPYNIKLGSGTQHWVDKGLAEPGEKAQDGGQFLKFKDPSYGEQAGLELLQGPGYRDLTVDAAMKRWSNNGYGAEIVKDIPADTKIKDLSAAHMRPLMAAMREREGWNAKPTGGSTAQAPATDPRIAQLDKEIARRTGEGKMASLLKNESLSTRLNDEANRLKDERKRLLDEARHQQERREEIPRAVEKQTALLPGELAKERAGAEVQREAKQYEPIGTQAADELDLPASTLWKDVPKDRKPMPRPSQGERDAMSNLRASVAGVDSLLTKIDDPKIAGMIGTIFTETPAAVNRLLGPWLATLAPEQRAFAATMAGEIMEIRHRLIGAGQTGIEVAALVPTMPSPADTDPATVRAKLTALREGMLRRHDAKRDDLAGLGFRVPAKLAPPAAQPAASGLTPEQQALIEKHRKP